MRDSTPITMSQTIRAFRRLSAKDSQKITRAAERLQEKTGMKLTEALQVLASAGMYLIRHED